jgi:hypothetical protein
VACLSRSAGIHATQKAKATPLLPIARAADPQPCCCIHANKQAAPSITKSAAEAHCTVPTPTLSYDCLRCYSHLHLCSALHAMEATSCCKHVQAPQTATHNCLFSCSQAPNHKTAAACKGAQQHAAQCDANTSTPPVCSVCVNGSCSCNTGHHSGHCKMTFHTIRQTQNRANPSPTVRVSAAFNQQP